MLLNAGYCIGPDPQLSRHMSNSKRRDWFTLDLSLLSYSPRRSISERSWSAARPLGWCFNTSHALLFRLPVPLWYLALHKTHIWSHLWLHTKPIMEPPSNLCIKYVLAVKPKSVEFKSGSSSLSWYSCMEFVAVVENEFQNWCEWHWKQGQEAVDGLLASFINRGISMLPLMMKWTGKIYRRKTWSFPRCWHCHARKFSSSQYHLQILSFRLEAGFLERKFSQLPSLKVRRKIGW